MVSNFFKTQIKNIIFSCLIPVLALSGVLTSCVTQQKVEYLQPGGDSLKVFTEAQFPDYKLKPNDELFVQINSFDEGPSSIFSNAGNQSNRSFGTLTPYGASLMSYSIDKDGFLMLPVIGNVLVKGKTLSQVNLILKDSLSHVLNQPIVSVKLVNRYISILGEVRNPGHFPYSQEKLSVYDAIGLAGDITDYGNRNSVTVIRTENGSTIQANVNLTDSEILSSSYYYLRPNDIVYVRPLRNKFWGMRQFPFSILFSTITTGILIYNVITR